MVISSKEAKSKSESEGSSYILRVRKLIKDRGQSLIKFGGVVAPLAAILTLFVLGIVDGSSGQLAVAVGFFALVGQCMVWVGLLDVINKKAWDDEALYYLIIGGILSAQTLFLTGVPEIMPIPLVAPIVGGVARWRLRRAERSAGVSR